MCLSSREALPSSSLLEFYQRDPVNSFSTLLLIYIKGGGTNKLGPVTEILRGFRIAGARGTATPIFGPNYAQLCQITLTCS